MIAYENNPEARRNYILALQLLEGMTSADAAWAMYKSDSMQSLFALGCIEYAEAWQARAFGACGESTREIIRHKISEAVKVQRGTVPEWAL